MSTSRYLFLVPFLLAFYATAQHADSLAYHPGKWGFEILTGTSAPYRLYKEYNDQTITTAYGDAVVKSKSKYKSGADPMSLLDYAILKPTFKAALNYKHNDYFSSSLGFRYYYTGFSTHYQMAFLQGSYIIEQVSDMYSSVHDCEFFLGEKAHFKNFFLGASLNFNWVVMDETEYTTYYLNSTHFYGYGHISYDSFFEDLNHRYLSFQPGAGVCLGYDIPLEKHFLELELSGDYYTISPKYTTLEDYKVGCLNIALSLGFKF